MIEMGKPELVRDDDQTKKYHYDWWQMLIDFIKMFIYTARGGK